jgi:hypothetical protein
MACAVAAAAELLQVEHEVALKDSAIAQRALPTFHRCLHGSSCAKAAAAAHGRHVLLICMFVVVAQQNRCWALEQAVETTTLLPQQCAPPC